MADPLTPEDAEDPLVEKLAYGIELEEQSMREVRTTFPLKWVEEYQDVMADLGEDGRFRSRTMCEMVIAREARKEYNDMKSSTFVGWGEELKRFVMCIDNDSKYYDVYKTRMQGAQKALQTINLGSTSEGVEYTHSATKEDINKLRYEGYDDDMFPWKKMQIGVCIVVTKNSDLFPPNLVDSAEQVVDRVKTQYDSLRQSALSYALQAGRIFREARKQDMVYEDYFGKRLESIKTDDSKDDKLYEAFMEGIKGGDGTIDLSEGK